MKESGNPRERVAGRDVTWRGGGGGGESEDSEERGEHGGTAAAPSPRLLISHHRSPLLPTKTVNQPRIQSRF